MVEEKTPLQLDAEWREQDALDRKLRVDDSVTEASAGFVPILDVTNGERSELQGSTRTVDVPHDLDETTGAEASFQTAKAGS